MNPPLGAWWVLTTQLAKKKKQQQKNHNLAHFHKVVAICNGKLQVSGEFDSQLCLTQLRICIFNLRLNNCISLH